MSKSNLSATGGGIAPQGNSLQNMAGTSGTSHAEALIPLQELLNHVPDNTQDYQEAEHLLTVHGAPAFRRGALIGITAEAKQGKSFFALSVIMTALSRQQFAGMRAAGSTRNVLWIDTEMSTNTILKRARMMLRTMGRDEHTDLNGIGLHVLSLRDVSTNLRALYIKSFIEHHAQQGNTPDIVLLDGVADLLPDVNDQVTANSVINDLMAVCSKYNACVMTVIHLNQGSSKMTGWIGTTFAKKCDATYSVSKLYDERTGAAGFCVDLSLSRDSDDVAPIQFCIKENSLAELPEGTILSKRTAGRTATKAAPIPPAEPPTDEALITFLKEYFDKRHNTPCESKYMKNVLFEAFRCPDNLSSRAFDLGVLTYKSSKGYSWNPDYNNPKLFGSHGK